MKMLALMKPKNAVTVSIIATVLAPLMTTERHARPHSQKDFERFRKSESD
jgi:hypothetical protein